MSAFDWSSYLLGVFTLPIGYVVIRILLVIFSELEYIKNTLKKKREIFPLWVESTQDTGKSIKLLSKKNKELKIIPYESEYRYEAGVKYTILGAALKMFFLIENKTVGPYYVKHEISNQLRDILEKHCCA